MDERPNLAQNDEHATIDKRSPAVHNPNSSPSLFNATNQATYQKPAQQPYHTTQPIKPNSNPPTNVRRNTSSPKPKNGVSFIIPVIAIIIIICAVIVVNLASNKKNKNSDEVTMSSNESIESNNEHSSQISTTTSLDSNNRNTISENAVATSSVTTTTSTETTNANKITISSIQDMSVSVPIIEQATIECTPATVTTLEGMISTEQQSDEYTIVASESGLYRFELCNVPDGVYHSLYLYNAGHEQITRNTSIGNGSGISANLSAGETYYISVKQSNKTGSYQLLIGEQKPTVNATEVNLLSDKISFTDQENNYEFSPKIDGVYRFELSDVPDGVYYSMYLFNSGWEQLDRNTSIGDKSGLTETLYAGKTYFVRVKQSTRKGSYSLKIGCQKETLDISELTIVEDSIQFTNQENYYSFLPKNDGTYRFEYNNVPDGVYYSMYLFNSGWEQIDRNTSIGEGGGLTEKLTAGKTYYIVTKQSTKVGSYRLLIGKQKETTDISNVKSVQDSIQFRDQENVYYYTANNDGKISLKFTDIPDGKYLSIYFYNSGWEQYNRNTSIGNNSGLTVDVVSGKSYYIVVKQSSGYCSYSLNIAQEHG